MRFHLCLNCKFFIWYDDDILGRGRDVPKDLGDRQRELYTENIELQLKVEGLLFELHDAKHISIRQQEDLSMEIDNLIVEIRRFDYCNKRQPRKL